MYKIEELKIRRKAWVKAANVKVFIAIVAFGMALFDGADFALRS